MHQYGNRRNNRHSPLVFLNSSTSSSRRLPAGGSSTPYRRSPCVAPTSNTTSTASDLLSSTRSGSSEYKQHSASPFTGSALGRNKYSPSPYASSAGYGSGSRDATGGRVTPSPSSVTSSSRLTPVPNLAKDVVDSNSRRSSRYDSHFSRLSNDINSIFANIESSSATPAAANRYLPSASASGIRRSSLIDRDSSYPGAISCKSSSSRLSPLPANRSSLSSSSARNAGGTGNGTAEKSAGFVCGIYAEKSADLSGLYAEKTTGLGGLCAENSAGRSGIYSATSAASTKNARSSNGNINLSLNEQEKSSTSYSSTNSNNRSSFYANRSPSTLKRDERGNRSNFTTTTTTRGRISPSPNNNSHNSKNISSNSAYNSNKRCNNNNNSTSYANFLGNDKNSATSGKLPTTTISSNKDKSSSTISSSSYAARLAEDYERVKNRFGSSLSSYNSSTNYSNSKNHNQTTNSSRAASISHVTSSGRGVDQSTSSKMADGGQSASSRSANGGSVDGRRSRSAANSPPPGGGIAGGRKTSWAKHYTCLSSQWAENTNSTLSVSKDQYSYKPVTSTAKVDPLSIKYAADLKAPKNFPPFSASGMPISKKDDSDYDDDSSDEHGDGNSKASGKTSAHHRSHARTRRRSTSTSKKLSSAMPSPAAKDNENIFDLNSSKSGKRSKDVNEDENKSSSDDELASAGHGSIDARIKARRRRLQKSRAMLQEQKEDSWSHRRYLQLEETKQKAHESSVNPPPQQHHRRNSTDFEQRRQERRNSNSNSNNLLKQSLDRVSAMVPSFSDAPTNNKSEVQKAPACFNVEKIHKTSLQPSWRTTAASCGDSATSDSQSSRTVRGSTAPTTTSFGPTGVALIVGSKKAKDFCYNEYVSSIAPKKEHFSAKDYKNDPTIALLETERELAQQAAALAKKSGVPSAAIVKEQPKLGKVFQNQLIANFDVTSTFTDSSAFSKDSSAVLKDSFAKESKTAKPNAKKLIEMFERTSTLTATTCSDSSMTSSVINGKIPASSRNNKISPNSELSNSLRELNAVGSVKSLLDGADSSDSGVGKSARKIPQPDKTDSVEVVEIHLTAFGGKIFLRSEHVTHVLFEQPITKEYVLFETSLLRNNLDQPLVTNSTGLKQYPVAKPRKSLQQQQQQQRCQQSQQQQQLLLKREKPKVKILSITQKETVIDNKVEKVEDERKEKVEDQKDNKILEKKRDFSPKIVALVTEEVKSPPASSKKSAETALLRINEPSKVENSKKVDSRSIISPKISTITSKILENLTKFDNKNSENQKISEPKMSVVLFDRQKTAKSTTNKKSSTADSANVSSNKKSAESNNLQTARNDSQSAKISSTNSSTIITKDVKKISTKSDNNNKNSIVDVADNKRMDIKSQQREKLSQKSEKKILKNEEKIEKPERPSKKIRQVPKDTTKNEKKVETEKIDGTLLKSPVSKRKAMPAGQAPTISTKTTTTVSSLSNKRTPASDNNKTSTLVSSINNDVSVSPEISLVEQKYLKTNLKHNLDESDSNLIVNKDDNSVKSVKKLVNLDVDSNLAAGFHSMGGSNWRVSSKSPSKKIDPKNDNFVTNDNNGGKMLQKLDNLLTSIEHSHHLKRKPVSPKSVSTLSINSLLQIDHRQNSHSPLETQISVRVVESSPEPSSKSREYKNKLNTDRPKYATYVESITATWPPKKQSDTPDSQIMKFHGSNGDGSNTSLFPDGNDQHVEEHSSARNLVAQLKKLEEQQKKKKSQSPVYVEPLEKSLPKTDPSVYALHRLPSVDREMLQLLTLGEELCASRSSLHTAYSQSNRSPPLSDDHSSLRSFRLANQNASSATPISQQPIKIAAARPSASSEISSTNQKRPSATSKEREQPTGVGLMGGVNESSSPTSSRINSLPKPWRPTFFYDREGSTDSLASFATANSQTIGSKESIGSHQHDLGHHQHLLLQAVNGQQQQPSSLTSGHLNNQNSAKPESLYRKALKRLNEKENSIDPPITFVKSGSHHSDRATGQQLDHASNKVDEMLRIARAKHKEERIRFKKAADELDKVCESMAQEFPASSVKYHEGSIDRKRDEHRAKITPGPWTYDKMKSYSFSSRDTVAKNENGGMDESKMDYTKRWLEGDLKSLASCDPKPDLLQFGSQCRIEADQRSIGSASAEVAAITNKDRLHALRVPDIVPKKCELLKPAPIHVQQCQQVQQNRQNIQQRQQSQQCYQQQQRFSSSSPSTFSIKFQNGQQPADKHQQSKAHMYKLYRNETLANGQLPDSNSRRLLAEHIKLSTNGSGCGPSSSYNSSHGHHYSRVTNGHSAFPIPPKKEFGGLVRKQVDMFDKMSDNESERSFLSDNVAYKNLLPLGMSQSGRVSLTDNMAGYIRKFESEDTLQPATSHDYGHGCHGYQDNALSYASSSEQQQARLETCRRGVKKVNRLQAQTIRRPSGSTQSLPILVSNHGSQPQPPPQQHYQEFYKAQRQQKSDLVPQFASWHTTGSGLEESGKSGSPAYRTIMESTTPKQRNSMQNVDNIVAELTLNTDHYQIPQSSATHHNKFPLGDNKKSSGFFFPVDFSSSDQWSDDDHQQQRGINGQPRKPYVLNAIPEYTEHYENIHFSRDINKNKEDSMTSYPPKPIGQSHSAHELLKRRDFKNHMIQDESSFF